MKRFFALFLFSITAFAHVEPGQYKGVDQNGATCEFTVHEGRFENNEPHPLNERIPVDQIKFVGLGAQEAWALGHPPVVDTVQGLARFNHDIFQAIKPTKSGAISVTLLKGDEGNKPKGIIFIDDNYRAKANSRSLSCML